MVESPCTVLLVDDNELSLLTCAAELEQEGYSVLQACDGESALELVDSKSIDLVLLDVVMPGLTGLDVLRTIRRSRDTAELPVIMATARDQSDDMVKAFELGANDYVTKPLDMPVVRARIRAQLRMRYGNRSSGTVVHRRLQVGSVLEGRYRIEESLRGGYHSSVYRANHLRLERRVAVKVLHADVKDRPDLLQRFQQEGISVNRLNHPNAVDILDAGVTAGGSPYLVMELLRGSTLEDVIRRQGALAVTRTVEILGAVTEVLTLAHERGILHRDVKPSNIFLHQGQNGEVVKLLDFGIAKWIGDASLGESITLDRIPGTPAYMAPERFTSEGYDGSVDVYSVGVVAFECFAGRPPFVARSPMRLMAKHLHEQPEPLQQLRPDLPAGIVELVHQAMAKEPEQRPTVKSMARELGRYQNLEPG